jgi:uncharacterized DUF497 family protein
VEIEFDHAKDVLNREKHGISLLRAAELFEQPFKEVEDLRFAYGEQRFIAYGLIEGRLFVCVYTWRQHRRRVISLRKANQRESDAYRASEQG